jgi:hypothetical protein
LKRTPAEQEAAVKARTDRRPSPSLVISILALVVALAGTGYAAVNLPKNSVGAKQLKRNAVTTAKIRKNAVTGAKVRKRSLTGADINLGKLGTVPSAAHASSADSIPPAEATHLVGGPGEPPFEEGSGNLGPQSDINTLPVGFFKDHEGLVHLQGAATVGTDGGIIFTLPPGFRPAVDTGLVTLVVCVPATNCEDSGSDNQKYVRVVVFGSDTRDDEGAVRDGQVRSLAEAGANVSLNGIVFRAES